MTDWLLIEDYAGPKNEERQPVICCSLDWDDTWRIGEGYLITEIGQGYLKEEWFWANDSCCCCHAPMRNFPTHYMPLPAPPNPPSPHKP